jgi:hypothetical protein
MTDDPNFKFDVTGAEIEAALARGDYEWLCKHVFNPALAQFISAEHRTAD